MKNLEHVLVNEKCSIKETMEHIDKSGRGIAVIVDDNKRLIGTVTDGDIRRAILNKMSIDLSVNTITKYDCIFINSTSSKKFIENIFKSKKILQIPVVDESMRVTDVIFFKDLYDKNNSRNNYALIMAGGLGTRLRPLTSELPKPMLKVGDKPILEIIIGQLKSFGITNILISVNYKAHIIESYFRNGNDFGVNIEYIREKKRLGTAGSLKLARHYLDKPLILVNGDILTKLNFDQFLDFHVRNNADITIATRKHDIDIPYGVVDLNDTSVVDLKEKPTLEFFVNAGMYCISPQMVDYIPDNEYYDITTLIDIAMKKNYSVKSFPIREYWIDIGQIQDYTRANNEYFDIFRSEISATRE